MMHGQQAASDQSTAKQQATTTTFDVVQSRDILQQLTGNSPGIYRKGSQSSRFAWIARFRQWIRNLL